MSEPEMFQRDGRAPLDKGATGIWLLCGHVSIQIVPLPDEQLSMWCAQCVNDFVKQQREKV